MQRSGSSLINLSKKQRALVDALLLKEGLGQAEEARIPRRAEGSPLPLSFSQERLWFLDQLEPSGSHYNIPRTLRLRGPLAVAALHAALETILQRHEVLRTTFYSVEGKPFPQILPAAEIPLPVKDLTGLPGEERQAEAQCLIQEEINRPFDLQNGPLFRASLLRLETEEHYLLLTMHHIVSDGWSLGVLDQELSRLYTDFCAGRPASLPPLPVQYADYAAWQRDHLQGAVLDEQLAYWKAQLADAPALLEIPTDRLRPAMQTFHGAVLRQELSPALTQAVKRLGQAEGTTLFMTLLAAFEVLLSRYSGQDQIVVGTPIANRTRAELEGLLGFFVNTLALRGDLSGDPSFRQLLGRVREVALGAYAHQDVPFEKLVMELHPERNLSHTPVFQVMFVLQNAQSAALELQGLQAELVATPMQSSKFDLTLYVTERNSQLHLALEYSTDLFDQATIQRLLGHYETLLQGIVADCEQPISQLPLLTAAERDQMLVEWNATKQDFPPACLHELVAEQAARTPDALAAVCDHQTLTYARLDAQADQLAHSLRQQGVGSETLVALCLERSLSMLVGVLGILKAGGAYVPLDPAYPPQRQAAILTDSRASLLLTQRSLLAHLPPYTGTVRCLDDPAWQQERSVAPSPQSGVAPAVAQPDQLAYLIYTSGSTGQPKGVAIEHHSAVTLVHWARQIYSPEELAGVLFSTSLCFDLSIFELFVPLSMGGCVVIAQNALHLPTLPAAPQVTLVNTVPSVMTELLRSGPLPASVRTVNLAGEPLPTSLVNQLYALPSVERVFDLYGPTEDTTYSTWELRQPDAPATIGRPVANTQAYVLDKGQQPVPIGVAGELYLGGDGLARGYLHDAERTAQKFVSHPFAPTPGARLYRTGDLVKWRTDGRLEYLGRLDHQVKVRGFRIELGEIETRLREHEAVAEAVVVVREDVPGDKRLVAYLVAQAGSKADWTGVRSFLKEGLPEYMLPAAGVWLPALPLTPNGKVDRKQLPVLDTDRSQEVRSFTGPRTPTETTLVQIWERLLQVRPIDIREDFFALGGHSLLAARLIAEIEKSLGRTLPLVSLFQNATVERLARLLSQQYLPRWTTLIPIQPLGTRLPIFCVGKPNVNMLGYKFLGKSLGDDQPLYGLQSQMRTEDNGPYSQTEYDSLAAEYIEAMRSVQPDGPYYLIGACQGGHLAFEMTRQLETQGQQVALLGMLDVWPLENTVSYPRWILNGYSRAILARIKRGFSRSQVKQAQTEATKSREACNVRQQWQRRYWPGPAWVPTVCQCPITVFRVRKQPFYRIHDRALGWQNRTTGGVEVRPIAGDHITFLRDPHVEVLAQHLKECVGIKETKQDRPAGELAAGVR